MSQTISQSERLRTEALQRPVNDVGVVMLRYRLQPADMADKPSTVIIRAVGAQGIEHAAPLLYFTGITKPLVLDMQNAAEIGRLAGSLLYSEWVGLTVKLYVVNEDGADLIRLRPGPRRSQQSPSGRRFAWGRLIRGLLWLVLLAFLVAAAYYATSHIQDLRALLVRR
jgi:hypothetical protein